jgi:LemA protein
MYPPPFARRVWGSWSGVKLPLGCLERCASSGVLRAVCFERCDSSVGRSAVVAHGNSGFRSGGSPEAASVVVRNGVVELRNQVDNGWAPTDVQLTRRVGMMVNLASTVKGYAEHETLTVESYSQATLGRLFALAESHPDLKSNQNVLVLPEDLTPTERRIACSRQSYNDPATRYGTHTQTFSVLSVLRLFLL